MTELEDDAYGPGGPMSGKPRPPHCPYCNAGLDRTAETGGRTFIHILTRGAEGQILKWHPCTGQQ